MLAFRIGSLIIALFIMTGCSKQSYRTGALHASIEKAEKIVPGASTMEDVENILGDPSNTVESEDGLETWIYQSVTIEKDHSKMFIAVPLFNVLSGGNKSTTKAIGRDFIKVQFLDGIVDNVTNAREENVIHQMSLQAEEYREISISGAYETLQFLPEIHETKTVRKAQDLWGFKGDYRDVQLTFDLSKLSSDVKIYKVYLIMMPESKKIIAKKIRKNRPDFYAPMVYLTGSNWSLLGSGIPCRCIQSGCTYNLSSESFHRLFTDLFGPGQGRNVYNLQKVTEEIWDVTSLFQDLKRSDKLYLRASADVHFDYIGDQGTAFAELLPPITVYKTNDPEENSCRLKLFLSEDL
jgi:hypothetical protein